MLLLSMQLMIVPVDFKSESISFVCGSQPGFKFCSFIILENQLSLFSPHFIRHHRESFLSIIYMSKLAEIKTRPTTVDVDNILNSIRC
jgi:hypothetical protein